MTKFLITGGAGSLGQRLVEKLSVEGNVIRVYDRDEYGLSQLPRPVAPDYFVRRIHGDIADSEHLARVMRGVDVVIHCAAMKNLDIAEYNLQSLIDTNIQGTLNVATLCQDLRVRTAIYISSDKAATGTSTYGVTKRMGEMIWKWAANTSQYTAFLTLRSGNFCKSRGNVFEVWAKQAVEGKALTVTDTDMWRYFIKTDDVADLVLKMVEQAGNEPLRSGRIVIPKMKQYRMGDLVLTHYPHNPIQIIGARRGESLREELLCRHDHVMYQDSEIVVVEP